MADWLKILTGALAGLLVGILSDPLRSWTNRKLKERQMRNALYTSMADLYGFFSSGYDPTLRERYPVAFIDANLDIFDYYHSTDKETFYRLREAPFVKTFFELVRKAFQQLHQQTPTENEESVRALITSVQSGIRFGSIDGKRLRGLVSNGPSWRHELNTDVGGRLNPAKASRRSVP